MKKRTNRRLYLCPKCNNAFLHGTYREGYKTVRMCCWDCGYVRYQYRRVIHEEEKQ